MRLGTASADKPSLQDLLQQYGRINYHLIQSARDRVQGPSRDQVSAPRQQWGKALTLIRKRKMHAPPENADIKNNLPTTQTSRCRNSISTGIPSEDVALAVLLGNVASRIDPTGELYTKLCESFQLSSASSRAGSDGACKEKWAGQKEEDDDQRPDLRDASLSDLLAHLKSMGLSDLVRSIQDRVVASIPTALATQRFRPLRWKLGSVLGKGAFGECRMALCEVCVHVLL